jgi:hypothetical protein
MRKFLQKVRARRTPCTIAKALLDTFQAVSWGTRLARRPRQANPHVEAALAAAEDRGWRVENAAGGHAHVWGRMLCPQATREGWIVFVHSTPRNPQSHAGHLQKRVDGCPHLENCEHGEVP